MPKDCSFGKIYFCPKRGVPTFSLVMTGLLIVFLFGNSLLFVQAGATCVPCNVQCDHSLQLDGNGCEICACVYLECEGLSPFGCTNPCNTQSCKDYRANNGEKDASECVPVVGDETCQIGCGCPDGMKVEQAPAWMFGAICVTNKDCGCTDAAAPDGYIQLNYMFKKSDETENYLCTCQPDNYVDCVKDTRPNPQCPVVNDCPDRCLFQDRDQCYRCSPSC